MMANTALANARLIALSRANSVRTWLGIASGVLSLEIGLNLAVGAPSVPVEHRVVYREAERFGGWPANHGIWSWGDEILVGFMAAWHQRQDISRHQVDHTKRGEAAFARSLDGGETWAIERPPEVVVVEDSDVAALPVMEAMEFSRPGFAFTLRFHDSNKGPSYFFFSYDKGHRWSGPHRFPDLGTPGILGRTDYIVHGSREMTVFVTAAKSNGREGRPLCARTTDGGMSWTPVAFIGPEPVGFSIMPSTVALDPQTFLTTVRVKDPVGNWIDAWISRDRGNTWSDFGRPVANTGGTAGNPPHLLRLQDGRLCLTYGFRSSPLGMRVVVSRDPDLSWGQEIILRDDGVTQDLGYPRSVQRADGKVVTVYYYNDGPHNERFISATIWKP
jgi:hypothetical protein